MSLNNNKETINDIYQLQSISEKRLSKKRMKIDFAFLSSRQNDFYEQRLNENINSCGCGTGKNIVGITFIICIFFIFFEIPPFYYSFSINISLVFFLTLLAAVFGKLLGIFLAKRKFKRIIEELYSISENNKSGIL